MSYCVNCGVELDPTASVCPLCNTPVINPKAPVDRESPPPFPLVRREVEPVDRRSLGLLLTGMLGAVAICCGLLNFLAFFPQVPWGWYVAGAAGLIWVWAALPFLVHMKFRYCLAADLIATAGFLALVAGLVEGWFWYLELALPIIGLTGFLVAGLAYCRIFHRSRLTTLLVFLGIIAVYGVGLLYARDLPSYLVLDCSRCHSGVWRNFPDCASPAPSPCRVPQTVPQLIRNKTGRALR